MFRCINLCSNVLNYIYMLKTMFKSVLKARNLFKLVFLCLSTLPPNEKDLRYKIGEKYLLLGERRFLKFAFMLLFRKKVSEIWLNLAKDFQNQEAALF